MKNLTEKSPYCPNIAANTGISNIAKCFVSARSVMKNIKLFSCMYNHETGVSQSVLVSSSDRM
jgi:hypothetical protein